MSRLIIKNLPNGMKEERFRSMFAAFGTVTDCSLKFTKDGKFRKFGFVGFKAEEDANNALKHFNKSFVDTSRVTVEMCKAFGDPTKAKAWSKHTQSSGPEKPSTPADSDSKKKNKQKKETNSTLEILEVDQGFKEFLSVHQNRSQAPTWSNDTMQQLQTDPDAVVVKTQSKKKHTDSAYESGDKENLSKTKTLVSSGDEKQSKIKKTAKQEMEPTTEFTVKLRGAPFNVKEQQIREFMLPLKPEAIRIGKNESGNRTGYVYVDLHSDEQAEKALKKNKDYIGGRYIEVFRVDPNGGKGKRDRKDKEIDRSFTRTLKEDEEEEDVAESGRLFIRNLPYTCTEEEIKELFAKHGPISEILFPIDNLTKKPKGFAFVMYMIPENAVTALAQLDGHIFQGRMLHLLPSTLKKEKTDSDAGGPGSSTYKRQKDAKNKASSSSSHNWNTLFLGTSAVADAIADKYNTTKSQVLDHESKGSLAVRMALGETQLYRRLGSFYWTTVSVWIPLVRQQQRENLPAGVTVAELEELFSPHGSLGRVLLPPSGLTAIIEFLESTEAKRAFTRLAYSKFQHIPLYLEWAPVDVFVAGRPEPEETLQETFSKCGKITSCTISKKQDKTGNMLSMGYGFVQYQTAEAAQKALRTLQHCSVDDHQLELKVSERATRTPEVSRKKKQKDKKQTGSKILRTLLYFGELKTVRLPKKAAGSGNHRGFGFIDFITKQDAKKAFAALCHSTHLYGRRLVLEWADAEETVETLRRKTAEHFHVANKKQRQSEVMEGIMENMETGGDAED
ncbi:putative RNA-binding protein 19 [Dissostichus eleginoides]|uniref:RNA-binding protein 19 n=1 Tax=Dissostichus eleginoides TaxID=100907 RepID=A0AAD9F9L6_DISEL|nr:putative RNA-binding protein 19 [Dissostichus eleginoides]